MIVVSDTSPIINLAVIGQLNLLPQLYSKVIIPHAVYNEIVSGGAGQAGSAEVANADWIEVNRGNQPAIAGAIGKRARRGGIRGNCADG